MALKRIQPGVRFSGIKVAPDEMDMVRQYIVYSPSVSGTWFGTAAAGTSTQAKPLVILGAVADYPRNLLGIVAGSSDMGGVWVVNGKNQFGETIQETITIGTAANGATVAGTKIFAEVTSGTFTFTTGAIGSGTPTLGVAIGTAANLVAQFGLPDKIGAVSDVKAIIWSDSDTNKSVNGGTVTSTYVGTANHTFNVGQIIATADSLIVRYKSTYSSEETVNKL